MAADAVTRFRPAFEHIILVPYSRSGALSGGKHARVRAAEGMADGNEQAFFASSLEQSIKSAADGFGVPRRLR
jgi:hypothetical protein